MAGFQDVFGTVSARSQRIVNFDSFILSHVPYGRVDPDKDMQIGLIEYDGPAADLGLVSRPLLAWHFGGIAHPITKAARVEYTFSYGDTGGLPVKASILIGFQANLDPALLKASPQVKTQPPPGLLAGFGGLPAAVATGAQTSNVVTGSALGVKTLDDVINGELVDQLAAVATAQMQAGLDAGAVAPLVAAANEAKYAAKDAAAEIKRLTAPHVGIAFDKLPPDIQEAVAYQKALQTKSRQAATAANKATGTANTSFKAVQTALSVSEFALRAWAEKKKESTVVNFDGPAQDANSLNPFNYTPQTLFNDKDKYAQVLWWYFGGRPYRVTKAMRIPVRTSVATAEDVESLFIGFAGPPGDSTA